MPLILAIEPDRRQANQLNAVVKGRLHADLVLADSAERALAELGDRVPDLVLTSALLSPTDEVVLGDRLRALNGVAAHVQTLTIPVLATPRPHVLKRAGGMLSALGLGRQQRDDVPDGCDPTVFAAQCAEYLERGAAERAANADKASETGRDIQLSTSAVEDPWDTSVSAETIRDFESSSTVLQPIAAAIESPREPIDTTQAAAVSSLLAIDPPREPMTPRVSDAPPAARSTPATPLVIDAPAAAATVQHAIAQIEAFVARESLASETIAKLEANENIDETAEDLPEGFIELDLSTLVEDPPTESPARRDEDDSTAEESSKFDANADQFVYDIDEFSDAGDNDPLPVAVAAAPAAKSAKAEKPRSILTEPTTSKRANGRRKAVQDDWGFFDPEQCGFAALIAKLDEIIKTEDRRPDGKSTPR